MQNFLPLSYKTKSNYAQAIFFKKIRKQISSRTDSETKKKDINDVRNEKEDKNLILTCYTETETHVDFVQI